MKLLASVLVSLMMLSMGLPSWAFSDTQQYWAQPAIDRVSSQAIIGGYPDGTFRPEGAITRAEFSSILMKAARLSPQPAQSSPFMDVPTTHWAFPAINAAKNAGLVNGFPGGMFYPNRTLTRTEAMIMLASAARLPLPSDAEAAQILTGYSDAANVPAWARRAVAASVKAGLLAQFPNANSIMPNNQASRGEVAAMVDNYSMMMANAGGPQGQMIGNMPPAMQPGQQMGQPMMGQSQMGQPQMGQPQMSQQGQPGMMQGYIATVAQGTSFTGTLTSAVSSETARPGDTVTLRLDTPLTGRTGDNQTVVVVPQGATISGMIRRVEASGRAGKNGVLEMDFNAITMPNGSRVPMVARIATESGTGALEGDTTKMRVGKALGKTAIGAGLGAALGTAMGPLSGGKVGKGAIYGTAIGGGLGAATALLQTGKDVELAAGQQLQLQLMQNLTVSP